MKNIFAIAIFIPTFLITSVACISLKKSSAQPFVVTEASYYSWVASEHEKGTTIKIVIKETEDAVLYDSLIFRKVMLPVRVSEEKNGGKTLIVNFPSGEPKLQVKTKHVDKPDQLIFHYKGERGVHLLKNIERMNMIYY